MRGRYEPQICHSYFACVHVFGNIYLFKNQRKNKKTKASSSLKCFTHHGTWAACPQVWPLAPPLLRWSPPGWPRPRWRCLCPWPEPELSRGKKGGRRRTKEEEIKRDQNRDNRSNWTSRDWWCWLDPGEGLALQPFRSVYTLMTVLHHHN